MIRGMLREVLLSRWRGHLRQGDIAHLDPRYVPPVGLSILSMLTSVGHGKHTNYLWSFNGDYEKPTFTPSMGANRSTDGVVEDHPVCHSHVRDGMWQFLGDCTHNMANHHVPMIPPDPDLQFRSASAGPNSHRTERGQASEAEH